jgi:hypothetical protein
MLKIKKLYLWSLIVLLYIGLNTQSAENEDYTERPWPQEGDKTDKATQPQPVLQEQPDEQQLIRTAFEKLAQTSTDKNGADLSIFRTITRILTQQKVSNITLEQTLSGITITLHTAPSNIQVDLNEEQTAALRDAITQILQPTVQPMPTRQPAATQQPNQVATSQASATDPNNGPTPPNGPGGPNGLEDSNKNPEDKQTKEEKEANEKKGKDKNPMLYDPRLLEQNKDKQPKDNKAEQKKDAPVLNNPQQVQQYPAYPNYYPMQDYQQTPHPQQQPKAVGGSTTDKTAFATQTPKPQAKPTTFEERQALVPEGTGKITQTENRVPEPSNQPRKTIVATPEPLVHQKVTDRTSSLKVVLAGAEEPVIPEQPKPEPKLTFFETVTQKITNFFLSCWQFMVNLLPFGK